MKRTKARYRAMCPGAARIRDPQSTLSLVLLRGRLDGPGHPLLHRQTARLGRLKGPRNDMRVHGARPTTSAMGHVWTAPWQELSDGLQHWSGAVTCPAC